MAIVLARRRQDSSALATCLLAFSIFVAGFSGAQQISGRAPASEGRIIELHKKVPMAGFETNQLQAWSLEISQPGTKYIRFEIIDIRDTSNDDYEVGVFRADLTRVTTYSRAEFSRQQHLWSPEIKGDAARIVVLRKNGRIPVGLSFTVSRYIYESPSAVLESIRDPQNPKLKPISFFPRDSALQQVARTVAKLRYVGDGTDVCTGFMVSADLLLTNQHCVPNTGICGVMKVFFDWDPDAEARAKEFHCIRLERVDPTLDFALVRLDGKPGDPTKWGHLTIDPRETIGCEPLYVVQYPGIRDGKMVARDGCSVTTTTAPGVDPNTLTDFGHSCDTKGGSSGSPVLSADNLVVGLHHWGFEFSGDQRWLDQNRAVAMREMASTISAVLHPKP